MTVEQIFAELRDKKKLEDGERYWFGVSGSWRKTNKEIEVAVREHVKEVIEQDGGIVTGGALNVDWFATDEALLVDPAAEHIRVYLPVTLDLYAAHYRKRAEEGVITSDQAEALIEQLTRLKETNPDALIEGTEHTTVDQESYYARNTEVMNASDALLAFQVNDSAGVEDTVQKAIEQGKLVMRQKWEIE